MLGLPWSEEFEKILRTHCRLVDRAAPLSPYAPFDLLGVDSIGLLGIIVDSEDAFDVDFLDELLTAEALATPIAFWESLQAVIGQTPASGGMSG
jgi:acyl carrier protein